MQNRKSQSKKKKVVFHLKCACYLPPGLVGSSEQRRHGVGTACICDAQQPGWPVVGGGQKHSMIAVARGSTRRSRPRDLPDERDNVSQRWQSYATINTLFNQGGWNAGKAVSNKDNGLLKGSSVYLVGHHRPLWFVHDKRQALERSLCFYTERPIHGNHRLK